MSTMRRGRSGGWYETLSEVPDASKDTQVDSSFGGLYLFAKLLFLRKISLSLARTEFPFFYACRLCQGFSGIFGNIPISFSGSAKRGDPDVYKGSRYPLIGLNPIPALTSG